MAQKDDKKGQSNSVDTIGGYFKSHFREVIAYSILVLGILIMFFDGLYGGILVGLVAGIYFGQDIIAYVISWKSGLNSESIARYLISAGIVVAFFISAPAIFLGAAITIALRQLLFTESK